MLPLVSVIIPFFNAESTLLEAVNSILDQSYEKLEIIIINDGSTDKSEQIIQSLNDDRIIYIKNEKNQGLIKTLNIGFENSTGQYIARMDADDISLKDRISKQVQYMEKNKSCVACGTKINYFGEKINRFLSPLYYTTDRECKESLMIYPCFAHPSIILKTEIIKNNNIRYNENYKFVEDYKLWIDLCDYGTFYNIPEELLNYRVSQTQTTSSSNILQFENAKKCRREYIQKCLSITIPDVITYGYIKEMHKRYKHQKIFLETLYLSIDEYSISFLFFYILNILFRYRLSTNYRIVKRFFTKTKSIL